MYGGWYYSATFDDLTKVLPNGQPFRHRGSKGFYLIADGTVYQDVQNPDRQLTLFSELGIGTGASTGSPTTAVADSQSLL